MLATVAPSRACSANACSTSRRVNVERVAREPVRALPAARPGRSASRRRSGRGRRTRLSAARSRPCSAARARHSLPEPVDGHAVLLAPPRLQRRHLRRARRASPRARPSARGSRRAAARSARSPARGTPSTSAVPCSTACHRSPRLPRQLRPQRGLVEVAGGLRVPVQLAAVERRPATVRAPASRSRRRRACAAADRRRARTGAGTPPRRSPAPAAGSHPPRPRRVQHASRSRYPIACADGRLVRAR